MAKVMIAPGCQLMTLGDSIRQTGSIALRPVLWFRAVLGSRRRQSRSLEALVAVAVVMGCDARNPAQISRARHPELYDASAEAADSGRPRLPPPEQPKLPPTDFSEVEGETIEIAPGGAEGIGNRVEVAAARVSGSLQIDVNDPRFPSRLDALFDGDTSTLSRTEEVNPLILVFRFAAPISIAAVRVFPSYSTYDWAVRPHPDGPRYLVRGAAEEQWSRIDLPEPVETGEVRLEVRRLVRDNYVHVNEVELLAPR